MSSTGQKIKILNLFYSGTGSTRFVSKLLQEKLRSLDRYDITVKEISLRNFPYEILSNYDYVFLGSPNHFMAPSRTMKEFIAAMPVYKKTVKMVYYFTTAAIPGNHARKFIKMIMPKNVFVIKALCIKAPGCDFLAFLPKSVCNRVEPGKPVIGIPAACVDEKLHEKINELVNCISKPLPQKQEIPSPKLSLMFVLPISSQMDHFLYIKRIPYLRILPERCINCQTCVKTCVRKCFSVNDSSEHPKLDTSNCEFCLGCVHHCPQNAIIFADYMKDVPRFNDSFFEKLGEQVSKS